MSDKEISVDSNYAGSDYGSSLQSTDTQSLSSTVCDYIYENGRRFHRYSEGAYCLPNDETEQDRLDVHHHCFLLLLGGALHLAPVESPHRVLDVGTGTGIWALDYAELHPEAEVIGTDLSPIQPSWVYPNCKFEVDDAELEWTWPDNHFDFIHMRNLTQSIRDWPRLLKQAFRCLKPGGWIEWLEIDTTDITSDDGTVKESGALKKYFKQFNLAMDAGNIPGPKKGKMPKWVEEAGFTELKFVLKKQPWAPWPRNPVLKEVGTCNMVMLDQQNALETYGMACFTRFLKMDPEDAKLLCAAAMTEIHDPKVHAYNLVFTTFARKPL